MLVAQLLPFVKNLVGRKWSDEDILEDVQFLKEELTTRFHTLTYVMHSAICCVRLTNFIAPMTNTPRKSLPAICHGHLFMNLMISGKKMLPNSMRRTLNNSSELRGAYIVSWSSNTFTSRSLINILKESTDPVVLAVAASDIGQYVRHHERGKK